MRHKVHTFTRNHISYYIDHEAVTCIPAKINFNNSEEAATVIATTNVFFSGISACTVDISSCLLRQCPMPAKRRSRFVLLQ